MAFSCSLCAINELPQSIDGLQLATVELQPYIPFTASQLVKIAPAFDPDLTTLLVVWTEDEKQLKIHSIARHASTSNKFSLPSIGAPGITDNRPDLLTINSRGPATIAVSRAYALLGTLQGGSFTLASPTPFTRKSLGAHLLALAESDAIYSRYPRYCRTYLESLHYLLHQAAQRGHGSTIVILPSTDNRTSHLYSLKLSLSDPCSPREFLEASLVHEMNTLVRATYRRAAQYALDRIAQLATIDGALILDHQLGVVGFGASLIASNSDSKGQIGPDGHGNRHSTEVDINQYGMRHRSAFNFVAQYPNAIAFVISQDGPVRALRRQDENTVHIWLDCNVSMFV